MMMIWKRRVFVTTTFLLLLLLLTSVYSITTKEYQKVNQYELQIPSSFTTTTTTTNNNNNKKLLIHNINKKNIINILNKYELDSHLEIVLLGDYDKNSVDIISLSLDQLTRQAISDSSLKCVHEKLLFHVTLVKHLENHLIDLLEDYYLRVWSLENEEKSIHKMLNILDSYHQKITATRTLFITHLSEPMILQSYVSTNGYALLDVHPNRNENSHYNQDSYGDIKPILVPHDTIPVSQYYTNEAKRKLSKMSTYYYDLSVQIFRSAEGLLPVPFPDRDIFSVNHVHDSLLENKKVAADSIKIPDIPETLPTHVHLQLITLCGHPLQQCQPDVISTTVLENLASESFSSFRGSSSSITGLTITHSSTMLRISNSVPLMSAVLASCQRYSMNNVKHVSSDGKELVYFSTKELLKHLSHSDEVVDLLKEYLKWRPAPHKSYVYVLPVISILIPDEWEGLLATEEKLHDQEFNTGRSCGRGIFEYGPNLTTFGDTISCQPFKVPAGRDDRKSHHRKRLDKLTKSDYYYKHEESEIDDNEIKTDSSDNNQRIGIDSAVVVLRSSGEDESTALLPGLVRSHFTSTRMLTKTGERLTRDATYSSAELFNALTQVIWDYAPPHVYYSRASQQIVTDYMWFDSLAWGMVSNVDTGANDHFNVNNNHFNHHIANGKSKLSFHMKKNFRQSTLFPRMRSFQVVDELLVRAVRATHLLDILGGFPVIPESKNQVEGFNKRNLKKTMTSLETDDLERTFGTFVTYLQSFLQQMHTVSIAFSHAEYQDALELCREAESTLLSMEATLHSSELRSSVKYANLFLNEDGNIEPGAASVKCKEKFSYYSGDIEEDAESGANQSFISSMINKWKMMLTSPTTDSIVSIMGVLLGFGGMSGYIYMKSGSSRKKYYR